MRQATVSSTARRPSTASRMASMAGVLFLVGLVVFTLTGASAPVVSLSSGPATFVIEGEVRAIPVGSSTASGCSGPRAPLVPGVPRCLVYQVHNTLDQPITVQRITMSLDPNFPAPPSGCTVEKLALPVFSGSLHVRAGAREESPGLPIRLKNVPVNQDDCRQKVLHFVFAGTANYGGPDRLSPDRNLPVTGVALGVLLLVSGGLVSAGLILLAAARRRRSAASR